MDNDKDSGIAYSSAYIAEQRASKIATISSYTKEFIIDGHKIANNKYFLSTCFSLVVILMTYAIVVSIQTIISPSIDSLTKFECIFGILGSLILPIYVVHRIKQKRNNKNDNNKNN